VLIFQRFFSSGSGQLHQTSRVTQPMIPALQRIPLMRLSNLRTPRSAIITAAVRSGTMTAAIAQHCEELQDLCRRFGVRRLEIFGAAARQADFDPARSAKS
jgi:hypothetical protein